MSRVATMHAMPNDDAHVYAMLATSIISPPGPRTPTTHIRDALVPLLTDDVQSAQVLLHALGDAGVFGI
jgi:hypothetical protein